MTTPTEDHWAQLSGVELVAELRRRTRIVHPDSIIHAALLRAAEVIEDLTRAIDRLTGDDYFDRPLQPGLSWPSNVTWPDNPIPVLPDALDDDGRA